MEPYSRCEWPIETGPRRGHECSRPSRAFAVPYELDTPGRAVCGIHRRVAERRGSWWVK